MRILHTSDWHLGISLHGVSLLEEQQNLLKQMRDCITAHQIDAVIIAGDIFDYAVAKPEAIELYTEAMTMLCRECGIPVLLCAGNHDGAARLASCSTLLQSAGLHIAGKLQNPAQKVSFTDTDVYLLPYFNLEQVRYLYPGQKIATYDQAMGVLTEAIYAGMDAGKYNILVAHCFVSGAQISESDRAAQVGGSSQIGAERFAGFDYVALGHLHKVQQVAANIWYSGSPLKYSFSEAGHEKSFIVLDTQEREITQVPVRLSKDLRVLKGTYEQLLWAARTDRNTQDYLKIELTDAPATMEKLEIFRAYYPDLLVLGGTSPETGQAGANLTVEQLSELTPLDILMQFYEDMAGQEPDEQMIGWFLDAAQEVDREVLQ